MDKYQTTMFVSILIIVFLIVGLGYTFYNKCIVETQIAKWKFKVTDWSISENKEISLVNTANIVSLEDGKIAPGASGEFEIELDATDSEMDVKYYIEINESGNKPSNLLFSVNKNGISTGKQYSSLQDLAKEELTGIISKSTKRQIETLTIVWNWPYEIGENIQTIAVEDAEDTVSGAGAVVGKEDVFDYTFTLKVIGTQAKVTN